MADLPRHRRRYCRVGQMSNAERIERWIAEWEAKRDVAREAGDYDAFAAAEREIANYRQMLAQLKC